MRLMLRRMRAGGLAVVVLLVASAGAAEAPRRAAWVWNNSVTESAEQRSRFLRFCRERRIDTLFLHAPMDHLQDRAEEFHAFLAAAHKEKMRVEALDGAPRWPFERQAAERFMTAVQVFNSFAKTAAERFDGVHVDAEPYDTAEWKASPERAAEQYLELLDALRAQKGELPLTVDVPPWFGEFAAGDGTLLSSVIDRADAVALMSYTNQVKGLGAEVRPALEYAGARGKRVWAGVSAQLYDSDMDAKRPVRRQVERVIKAAERQFRGARGLRGVAIHDLEHFRMLYDGKR